MPHISTRRCTPHTMQAGVYGHSQHVRGPPHWRRSERTRLGQRILSSWDVLSELTGYSAVPSGWERVPDRRLPQAPSNAGPPIRPQISLLGTGAFAEANLWRLFPPGELDKAVEIAISSPIADGP